MALTRPLKEGSVTTYQQKVALGFPDILASEMDADLDTIYAAWNGSGTIGWNQLSGGTVAAGGDLAGSTYPNPVIAAGKITKAKLAGDTSGLVIGDFATPSVGASSTALVTLLDLSANATLSGRFYRLSLFGSFSKAVACDLTLSVWLGGAQVAAGIISTTAQGTESCLYQLDLLHWFSGGTTYHSTRINISGAVPAAPGLAPFARGMLRTASTTGTTAVAPYVGVQFSVSNAGNGVARFGAAFEVL